MNKMIKTRTLTFHYPINNGAFLQSYALQRVLNTQFGVTNEIIDYRSPSQEATYSIFQRVNSKESLIKNVFSFLHYGDLKRRQQSFYRMQREFLTLTERVTDEKAVYRLAEEADLNIVGSDQVWNTAISACTPAFFLHGVNAKKITYAASVGSHTKVDSLNEYIADIKSFNALGIREPALLNILEFYDKEKTVVLDPTLLLDKNDYAPLYASQSVKGKFILLYSMRFSQDLLDNVKRISDTLGLPVIVPFTTYKTTKCLKYKFKIIYDASPDVFLSLIDQSELILTNSFHGTAFSIIFEKNFFHLCDTKNSELERDDRIDDLLDALEIKRNIGLDSEISSILKAAPIQFSEVNARLAKLREVSINFLNQQINTIESD